MPMLLTSIPRPHALLFGTAAVLAIAYLFALSHRPPTPDWKREQDPDKHGFPSWFGAPEPTATPDDLRPKTRTREPAEEILLFIDLTMDSPFLSTAIYLHDVLASREDIKLKAITRGSREWDQSRTTEENLEAAGCRGRLWRVGQDEGDLGNACKSSTVINQVLGDRARASPRANVTVVFDPNILVSKDMSHPVLAHEFGSSWEMGLFVHVIPFANPVVFYPDSRTVHRTVTYFPRQVTSKAQRPVLPKSKRFHIFTSRPPKIPTQAQNYLEPTSKLRVAWGRHDKSLVSEMSQAGVCLFEGWQDGLVDWRMVQAMLSGCLVATVPPRVVHTSVDHLVLPLKESSEQVPAVEIEAAMGQLSDAEFKKRVLDAFIFARQYFVAEANVEAVFHAINAWDNGGRGYMFPHSFQYTGSQ